MMEKIFSRSGNLLCLALSLLIVWGGALFILPVPAGADPGDSSPSETVSAALRSIWEPYRERTAVFFSRDLQELQQAVNGLSERIEKVLDPRTEEGAREISGQEIAAGRASLRDLANSFAGLADEAGALDGELERAARELLELVQGSLHRRLTDQRDALSAIAGGISSFVEDTEEVAREDGKGTIERLGSRIETLNRAIETADRAVKALATLSPEGSLEDDGTIPVHQDPIL
jgi:hypothetical protein